MVSGEPQVTIGAGGRFAAWSQLASPNPPVLKNAWGSASDFGSWGADLASHVSADTGYEVETPRVALDASGRAVAVFRARKIENSDFVVRIASTGFINGGWSPQVTLATGGNGSTQPDVAVDPAGDAIAVWRIGATVSAGYEFAHWFGSKPFKGMSFVGIGPFGIGAADVGSQGMGFDGFRAGLKLTW